MTVRMKDIARDLDISVMTVSKALRNHSDIGKETKERVLKRAAELDYRIDWVARSMATGRTYLIGLVVPDLMQSFFAEIAAKLAAALAPAGYHVVISYTDENAADEIENIEVLLARKVDGLIIATAQQNGRKLRAIKTPYVLVDRAIAGLNANFVGSNDDELGTLATEHLIDQGCRRIVHLSGPDSSAGRGRTTGYRNALTNRGIKVDERLIVPAGHDDPSGHLAMQKLLQRKVKFDGVFGFNDPVAIGAMRAMLDAGLSVPKDAAIIGAANMRYADMARVPLSTVDQGTAEMALQAAHLLLEAIAQGDDNPRVSRQVQTPLRLVPRASSLRQPIRS